MRIRPSPPDTWWEMLNRSLHIACAMLLFAQVAFSGITYSFMQYGPRMASSAAGFLLFLSNTHKFWRIRKVDPTGYLLVIPGYLLSIPCILLIFPPTLSY